MAKVATLGFGLSLLVPIFLFFLGPKDLLLHMLHPMSLETITAKVVIQLLSIPIMIFYIWMIKINRTNIPILLRLIIFPGIFYAFYAYWFKRVN